MNPQPSWRRARLDSNILCCYCLCFVPLLLSFTLHSCMSHWNTFSFLFFKPSAMTALMSPYRSAYLPISVCVYPPRSLVPTHRHITQISSGSSNHCCPRLHFQVRVTSRCTVNLKSIEVLVVSSGDQIGCKNTQSIFCASTEVFKRSNYCNIVCHIQYITCTSCIWK